MGVDRAPAGLIRTFDKTHGERAMATANPAMNEAVYQRAGRAYAGTSVMTLEGTVVKTAGLLLVLIAAAGYTWYSGRCGLAAHVRPADGGLDRWIRHGPLDDFRAEGVSRFRPPFMPRWKAWFWEQFLRRLMRSTTASRFKPLE